MVYNKKFIAWRPMNNPTGLITTLFSKIKKGEGVPIILVDQVIVICVFSLQKRVKKKELSKREIYTNIMWFE